MTPALAALLKEVEALNAPGTIRVTLPTMSSPVIGGPDSLTTRLAAMLRVAVEALRLASDTDPWVNPVCSAATALTRIEALAKGEA